MASSSDDSFGTDDDFISEKTENSDTSRSNEKDNDGGTSRANERTERSGHHDGDARLPEESKDERADAYDQSHSQAPSNEGDREAYVRTLLTESEKNEIKRNIGSHFSQVLNLLF